MKMKKLIAVLLACVMLCTLSVPAMGETMYEFLKQYLSDSSVNSNSLGTPRTISYDKGEYIFMYYMDDGSICLSGVNAQGQGEACFWSDVDELIAIATFYAVSLNWEMISGICDPGYSLVLAFTADAESDPFIVDDAASAAAFTGALDSILN